jgi:general secretion pathway protein G
MFARKARKTGFTLVEILIVVVILGILAAIVIPQFTNASEEARANSLITQLQSIRSQLELYQVQHNGDYPTLAQLNADWGVMVSKTDATGAIGNDPDIHRFGPYLQQPPRNPFENGSITCAAAAAAGVGWVYIEADGAIFAVMAAAKADTLKLDTNNDVRTY